jgi:putative transposase
MRVRVDERILGSGDFVKRVVAEAADWVKTKIPAGRRSAQAREDVARVCAEHGVNLAEVQGGGRRRLVFRVRRMLAHHLVTVLGVPLTETARHLGVTTAAISRVFLRRSGAGE